jgi:cytochrome c553
MMAFRSGKRLHKEMRYMAREMTPAEIAALAAYYAALPPR